MSDDDDVSALWVARLNVLEVFFGPPDGQVIRGAAPFFVGQDLGGDPAVLSFSNFSDGTLFVTADLIGADHPLNAGGSYELAMEMEGDEDWGVRTLCQLAHYSAEFPIDDGDTMRIDAAVPEDATVEGLLFRRIAEFEVEGIEANVLCCIGITGAELAYREAHGAQALIDRLGHHYLTTDLYRKSVV